MDERINIIDALKKQAKDLRQVLERDIKVGDTYPGESQVATIQSLIDRLEAEIKEGGSGEQR